MTAPPQSRIIAEVGGFAIAERGPLVVLVDRGTGALATLAFVIALLALVFGGFGALALVLATTGGAPLPWWLGAIFLTVGAVSAGAVCAVVSRIRDAMAQPVDGYRPVAVFDRARRLFLDADGAVVARFDQVRIQTRRQLTSSSAVLVASTPGGTRILKRGNPFNGGIGGLQTVLIGLLFGHPR